MKVFDFIDEDELLFITIETESQIDEVINDQLLYSCWSYKNMSISPENNIEKFKSTSRYYPTFGRITTITVGKLIKDEENNYKGLIKTYSDSDELKLLKNFNNFLNKLNDNNRKISFIGYQNGIFDLPFIFKRMVINNIKPNTFLDKSNLKPWEIKDVDLFDVWRGNSINVDNIFSIAHQLKLEIPLDIIIKASSDKQYPRTPLDMFAISQFKIKLIFNLYLRLKHNINLDLIEYLK